MPIKSNFQTSLSNQKDLEVFLISFSIGIHVFFIKNLKQKPIERRYWVGIKSRQL
jgi:hypothetical protein